MSDQAIVQKINYGKKEVEEVLADLKRNGDFEDAKDL